MRQWKSNNKRKSEWRNEMLAKAWKRKKLKAEEACEAWNENVKRNSLSKQRRESNE